MLRELIGTAEAIAHDAYKQDDQNDLRISWQIRRSNRKHQRKSRILKLTDVDLDRLPQGKSGNNSTTFVSTVNHDAVFFLASTPLTK